MEAIYRRSYEDFQPSFNWVREEGQDTLVVHLHGFKRDQLKVQIDSHSNLKISGERPLDDNKWSRFRRDFLIPKNSNTDEIHAKFVGGVLYVKLPKRIKLVNTQDQITTSTQEPPAVTTQDQTTPTQEAPASQETISEKKSEDPVLNSVNGAEKMNESMTIARTGSEGRLADGLVLRLNKNRRLVVGVAVAVTVLVALGVYEGYRLWSSSR